MFSYGRVLVGARLARMQERGASAVEYGLLIAGIAAVVVAVVILLGDNVREAFSDTNERLENGGN